MGWMGSALDRLATWFGLELEGGHILCSEPVGGIGASTAVCLPGLDDCAAGVMFRRNVLAAVAAVCGRECRSSLCDWTCWSTRSTQRMIQGVIGPGPGASSRFGWNDTAMGRAAAGAWCGWVALRGISSCAVLLWALFFRLGKTVVVAPGHHEVGRAPLVWAVSPGWLGSPMPLASAW